MKCGSDIFGRATFVMDRGYDDNKMFLKLDDLKQDYVFALPPNGNYFSTENGFLPHSCVISGKEKLKHLLYSAESATKLIFPT